MTKPRKSKWIIVLLLLAGLPLLVCGGLVTWWFGRQAIASREFADRKSEIAARGLPIDDQTMTEFRAGIMDAEKSDRWMKILETVDSKAFHQTALGIPIVGPQDVSTFTVEDNWRDADKVTQFLDANAALLTELHDMLDGTAAIWTKVDIDSFNTLLPYAQSSRSVSRLLALENLDAIRRDDHELAFRSAKAMMAVARAQEKEPLLICQLVSIAECSAALRQWKMMIEQDTLTESQLLELLDQLKKMDDFGNGFRLAIAGERAMAIPVFDDPSRSEDTIGYSMPLSSRPIDALSALDFYERAEAVNTSNLKTFLTELADVEAGLDAKMQNASILTQFDNVLTALLLPAFKAYGIAVVRSTMERRLTKLAIAVRLYEKRFGQWPQRLADLEQLGVDLGPLDPLGSKPFGYRIVDAKDSSGQVVLWGFNAQAADDQVPDQPTDLTQLDENDLSQQEFWNWKLTPSSQ